MKLRYLLLGLIILLLAWAFWPRTRQPTVSEEQAGPTSVTNVRAGGRNSASNSSGASPEPALSPEQRESEYKAKLAKSFEEKNSPLDFYGRVIDQDSNSLAGVKIHVRVRHWDLATLGASIPLERDTDENGHFNINGVTGDNFSVESIAKDGYELEPMKLSYPSIQGSPTNPVIFKLWQKNAHEKLITGSKPFHIIPDGRPYFVSFGDDTISESGPGDLKVWINYATPLEADGKRDWSCELTVVNGGLIEETNGAVSMYVAPTADYSPMFQLHQRILDGQHGSIGEKRFYVRLNNGQEYGRIIVDLIAPFNSSTPGLVRLQYAVNPSGSRVLR